MPSGKAWWAGLAMIAIGTPALHAQIPTPPVGAGASGLGGAASSAIPGATSGLGSTSALGSAAGQSGGFFGGLQQCCQNLKNAFCASQFGQMAGSLVSGPMGAIAGGFIPSICPPPGANAAQLAQTQPGSAAAAAAAIQASEAGAAARVAAIEYLGTVDCTRWPVAQKALINGLRADPNECVRFAAARALNSGCCCNKDVIKSLRICVAGESSDGSPAENSARVKAAAFSALQRCLMCVPEDLPPEPLPPVPEGDRPRPPTAAPPPPPERSTQRPTANPHVATAYNPPLRRPNVHDERVERETFAQTVDDARRTLLEVSKNPRTPAAIPPGQRSLFGALVRARSDVGTASLRRAREQGLVPPRPDQLAPPVMNGPMRVPPGAAAEPGTFSPGSAAGGVAIPTNPGPAAGPGSAAATEPPPEGAAGAPGPMSSAEPPPSNPVGRRGLIGALFASRGN
jgi:hypothetical protein